MSQILLKKSSPLSNDAISNGGLFPTTSDAGLIKIAGTECFDPSVSSARDLLFDRWDKSFPHIVRVIGSLPGERIVNLVKRQLLKTFINNEVGTVLIGGTETRRQSDLHTQVSSIPGLALDLQGLAYDNSVYGKMFNVFGTVPVGKQSIITEDCLTLLKEKQNDLGVTLQKGLNQALLFSSPKSNIWMAEASGVVETVDQYLAQNQRARYTLIFVGGGAATRHEYFISQDILCSSYQDRVQIIPIAGTGGFAQKLCIGKRLKYVNPVNLSSGELSKKIRITNQSIPPTEAEQTRITHVERDFVAMLSARLGIIGGSSRINASKNENQTDAENLIALKGSLLLPLIISFADKAGRKSQNSRQLSAFNRLCAKIQRLGIEHDNPIENESSRLMQGMLIQLMRRSELSDKNSIRPTTLLDIDPLIDQQDGQILEVCGKRLLLLTDLEGQRAVVTTDGELYPSSAITALPVNTNSSIFNSRLKPLKLNELPETIPAWRCLEAQGGFIRFKDANGEVVGYREILKAEDAFVDGESLIKMMYQQVTAIDVDLKRNKVKFVREVQHVDSLIFAPSNFPEARQVEVFAYTKNLDPTSTFPDAIIDTSFPSRLSSYITIAVDLSESLQNRFTLEAINASTERVQYLSDNLNNENISCLTGIDQDFEHSLLRQQNISKVIADFNEVSKAWMQNLGLIDPEHLIRFSRTQNEYRDRQTPISERIENFIKDASMVSTVIDQNILNNLQSRMDEFLTQINFAILLQNRVNLTYSSILYTFDNLPFDLLDKCEDIVNRTVIDFQSGSPSEFVKLKSAGGSTSLKFTAEYFLQLLKAGGNLLELRDNIKQETVGFAIFLHKSAINEALKKALPLLAKKDSGYYMVFMGENAPPTGSTILHRATLLALQHTNTNSILARIHVLNEASMKSALAHQFRPIYEDLATAYSKTVGAGFESRANTWECSISPELRNLIPSHAEASALERRQVIKALQSESGGFMHATQAERRQMQSVALAHSNKLFCRFSIGLASMSEQASADLRYLVDQGTFAKHPGVFCLASTREAELTTAGWILRERGPYELMRSFTGKLHPESYCLGLATTNTRDKNYGKSIKLELEDGEFRDLKFKIAATETEDQTKLTVIDDRDFKALISPIVFPKNYTGNLSIYHLEQYRAREFSEMFDNKAFIFISGGGVNAWFIKLLAEELRKDPNDKARVLLISGFGGSTDKLANDQEWLQTNQELIEQGRLVIINPLESEERRQELQNFF